MRKLGLMAAMMLGGCASLAPVSLKSPTAENVWDRGVQYAPMGSAMGAKAATLAGSQREPKLYTIRVHIEKGGSIAPHTHPDDRILTVVAGEVWYGFGKTADILGAKLYREGDVLLVPGNEPHFAFARDSFVVYQEAGAGPTAFVPVK